MVRYTVLNAFLDFVYSVGSIKTTTFWKLVLLPSSGEMRKRTWANMLEQA
jgi:hypothetical protein